MRRSTTIYKKSLRFLRWSHNTMAVFLSMKKEVQIGNLNVSISQNLAQKDDSQPVNIFGCQQNFAEGDEPDLDIDFITTELVALEQTPAVASSISRISSPTIGIQFYKSTQPGPFRTFF